MKEGETEQIKASLINFPELVKKIETYFSKETPAAETAITEEVKKEEAPKAEQDFSIVIAEFEKNFTKVDAFESFKVAIKAETDKAIATLTSANTELAAKFDKQEGIIKEIFEIIKKIGETPAEESKFKKKDGVAQPTLSKIDQLMLEAKELSAKTFK